MKFRSLSYYLQEAVVSLFRNRLMALASIITVMSCVFIISFSFCLAINIDYILEQMEHSLSLSVYIDDELSAEDVPLLSEKIQALPNVKSVRYISAEEAIDLFAEELGPDGLELLDGLREDNPMPRSFIISLDDIKHQDILINELNKMKGEGIDSIRYDQQIINSITTLNTGIRVVSIIIIICLVILAIVLIMNTIKITVNSRRAEIVIMKYIGATDWFIRWPFIIEGILIGLIGAIIPITVCWFGYAGAAQAVYDQLKMLQNLELKSVSSVFFALLPIGLFIGVGIGVVGSVTSIRKYLQV